MITSGGVRLAGEYVFKQDRMSENWYVVHTQPRGEKMLKALLDREPAVADTYLPMRQQFARVSRFLVGINFRHPNVMPNFAVWKTITYRLWHRWCCQPRF